MEGVIELSCCMVFSMFLNIWLGFYLAKCPNRWEIKKEVVETIKYTDCKYPGVLIFMLGGPMLTILMLVFCVRKFYRSRIANKRKKQFFRMLKDNDCFAPFVSLYGSMYNTGRLDEIIIEEIWKNMTPTEFLKHMVSKRSAVRYQTIFELWFGARASPHLGYNWNDIYWKFKYYKWK